MPVLLADETTTTPVLAQFADRVNRACEVRGLTSRDVAMLVGGDPHQIKNVGLKAPSLRTVWAMARALEVEPVWLAFGAPSEEVPGAVRTRFDDLEVRWAFAERVAYARRQRGLSQRQLARLVGVGQPNVSARENKVEGFSLATMHTYRDALDVPANWLMDSCREIEPWDC